MRRVRTFVHSSIKEDKSSASSNRSIENDLTSDKFDRFCLVESGHFNTGYIFSIISYDETLQYKPEFVPQKRAKTHPQATVKQCKFQRKC
jgi:hypothetical protein